MAKKIQFSRYGSPNVLDCVDFTPIEPEANQVMIANKAIGINYIDTYMRSGLYPMQQLPSGLGIEAAGIVAEVGDDVKHLSVGDRVVYCHATPGAYSDYHNVAADQVVKLPDDISFKQAAACFLKGLTVYSLFRLVYPLQSGEFLLFYAAAGGVGQIACQWANALGAKLIGIVSSEQKAEAARQAGAWATINYQQEDIAQRVAELTEGAKVPVVYDSVGQSTWLSSLNSLQPCGLMVSFGNASGPVTGVDLTILNQKGGLFVTRPSLFWYLDDYIKLQAAADTLFQNIISGVIRIQVPKEQVFALSDVRHAHTQLEGRQTMGSSLLIP